MILILLYAFAFILTLIYLPSLIRGICTADARKCVVAILIPVWFWVLAIGLYYADHKFMKEETHKNNGQLLEWVR